MTADIQALRNTLEELHNQLVEIDTKDDQAKDMLRQTLAEIQQKVAKNVAQQDSTEEANPPLAADDHDKSLSERLSEAAGDFEQSHPNIANTISGLIDALGRMGI